MKVAICFFGLAGIYNLYGDDAINKFKKYGDITFKFFDNNIKKYADIDVFFHCWNADEKTQLELLKQYNPKSYIFEDQYKIFPDIELTNNVGTDQRFGLGKFSIEHACNCRYYSQMKSLQLLDSYQIENNIKYDFVLISMFDVMFLKPIIFSNLNNDLIYTGNWHNNDFHENDTFLDYWYIGNPENIINICSLYDKLKQLHKEIYNDDKSLTGSHKYCYQHIKNLNMLDKIKLNMTHFDDFIRVKENFMYMNPII